MSPIPALLLVVACAGTDPVDGPDATTPDGDLVHEYDDVGAACIRTAGDGNEVVVDFDDCLFCSTNELHCTVSQAGDRLEVTASGRVLVEADCSTGGTCEPVEAWCDAPDVEETVTLAYAGNEVQVTLPSADFVCTAP